jgi:hypothetical protein
LLGDVHSYTATIVYVLILLKFCILMTTTMLTYVVKECSIVANGCIEQVA